MNNDDIILNHYQRLASLYGDSSQCSMKDHFIRQEEWKFISFHVALAFKEFCFSKENSYETFRLIDLGGGNGLLLKAIYYLFVEEYLPSENQFHGSVELSILEFSPDLVEKAKENFSQVRVEENSRVHINIIHGDMRKDSWIENEQRFHAIITERSLINIISPYFQWDALKLIPTALALGGRFICVESFQETWENLNLARKEMCIEKLKIPRYNRYLTLRHIKYLTEEANLKFCESHFSIHHLSTHFYLTRVLHYLVRPARGKLINNQFVKFMNIGFGPGVGEYAPIQFHAYRNSF